MSGTIDPAVNVRAVWEEILSLGYTKTRIDRAEKDGYAVEVGYGSSTIRVRMFKIERTGAQFIERWDIAARSDNARAKVREILADIRKLSGEKEQA